MKINVKSSTMVKPMEETPIGTQWLSSLDLLMPSSYHTRSILYYRRHDAAANFFDAATLKAAISRALVEFYPYAGRLKKDCNGRMEIEFNGEGVQFVEAEADGEMDELGDFFAPNPEMIKLIPAVDYSRGISTFPLFLLQVTRFNCGGVSLGVANEHHISDGTSALHFINTWSDMARGVTTITTPPFFDRRLLSARNPPQLQFPHIEFQPPPALKTPLQNSETTFSVFKLTHDHLNALKAKCNDDKGGRNLNYSTYEVITGHVWRCVCMARGLARDQETKLHIPVDGRHRLRPPLPRGYFGNVIFSASAVASGGEIVSNPLKFAVGEVHETIARMDDEYLRSALDYLELCGDITAIARGPHTTRCPNLGITSWVRLPMYDADFGWGKPVYVGPGAAPFEGKSYLLPSPENDGSLFYAVTLIEEDMKKFEKLLYDI